MANPARPLRVALDATSLYDPLTGVGRFTSAVLEEAAARPGLEVLAYAITLRGRSRLADLVPVGVRTPRRRVPMAASPLRFAWRRWNAPRIDRWIGSTDVVHGTNYLVPPSRAATVVTVHDLTYLHFPQMCTASTLHNVALVERAVDRGATVHTDSDFVRAEVMEHYRLPEDRVVTVPLGVTAPPRGDEARGRALAGAGRYLLSLGTVEPRKDLTGLVAAFEIVARADHALRLVIAGPDGWGAGALVDAIGRSPVRSRIVRTGWVHEAARGDLLAGALALVVPSVYEGFGLPAIEAMAVGTPVVTTAVGAIPEVVGDAALLVPGSDIPALAAALVEVVGSAELRARFRAAGPERASRFTWERTVDGLEALWRRVAGR